MSDILIASIFPFPQREFRPLYGGVYELPAVERDQPPAVIRITDKIQMERAPGMRDDIRRIINARDIANDLIQSWTTNAPFMTAVAKPGIWICSDPNGPTQAEIDTATEVQGRYAEGLVAHVDAIPEKDRAKQIRDWPLPRALARWSRIERDWLSDMKPEQRKPCPYCAKPIDKTVIKCPHCQEIVDDEAYAIKAAHRETLKREIMKSATKANLTAQPA